METGTKVRLKTRGPVMTVTKRTAAGYLVCTWCEGGEWKRERMFFPELVVVADEEPPAMQYLIERAWSLGAGGGRGSGGELSLADSGNFARALCPQFDG